MSGHRRHDFGRPDDDVDPLRKVEERRRPFDCEPVRLETWVAFSLADWRAVRAEAAE